MKKKILFLNGSLRDYRELAKKFIQDNYTIIFEQTSNKLFEHLCNQHSLQEVDSLIHRFIKDFSDLCIQENIAGIVSKADYPTNILKVALTEALQLPGPSLQTVLSLEHKFSARLIQKEHVPEAVPFFMLINPDVFDLNTNSIEFPCMVKPVKSSFSRNVHIVSNVDELAYSLKNARFPISFLHPFNFFLSKYLTLSEYDGSHLIAESLLTGYQITVEGFVYKGKITILGIVDSIMYPGTISFERFEYPSSLEHPVQDRMCALVSRLMQHIDFDNSLFNVECVYNPSMDQIHIIEINPRISSQFADLFERVDGINTYRILLDLAVGRKPEVKRKEGQFNIAASCVLRLFEDQFVEKIPSKSNLKYLVDLFPDMHVEIYAKEGKKLSAVDELQDGKSFRYGIINLGAFDHEDLMIKFHTAEKILDFKFKSI
ncbi:MAG: ATP-grasp domain-containing protein [Candidatus Babeliales bacterium]